MEEERPLINRSSRIGASGGSIEFSPSSQERRSSENTNDNRNNSLDDGKSWSECFWHFIFYGPNTKESSLPRSVNVKKESNWYDAWNITANTREIFIRERDTDLNVLDGVRALAYIWVFNDHLLEMLRLSIDGFFEWELSMESSSTYFSLGSQFKGDQGVTSFFILSGFLIPFTFTRLIRSKKERYLTFWTASEYLFRRYARIAPAIYVATIVVIIVSSTYSSDSVIYDVLYEPCKLNWYQNYLFFNNYSGLTESGSCYDSVWTISLEMQLYVLSIIPVLFYTWEPVYGYYAGTAWVLCLFFLRLGLTFWTDTSLYDALIYTTVWGRGAEYGVGILLFFIYEYYHCGKSATERRTTNVFIKYSFWTGLIGILAFGFFYLFSFESDWWHSNDNQYQSLFYFVYALTLSSAIYLCIDGTFWPIKWILSWYVWYPIAQLAYPAGLLNILICGIVATVAKDSFSNNWTGSVGDYIAIQFMTLLFSLTVGYILAITVERPFFNLSKSVKF